MLSGEYKNEEEFKNKAGYIINDAWYPRVTKIVEIKSKPALYRYYGAATSYDAAQAKTQKQTAAFAQKNRSRAEGVK